MVMIAIAIISVTVLVIVITFVSINILVTRHGMYGVWGLKVPEKCYVPYRTMCIWSLPDSLMGDLQSIGCKF